MKNIILIFLLLFTGFSSAFSQTTIVRDSAVIKGTTVVIPGKQYKRNNFHNALWGHHYRTEWSTAIRVNNFQLDEEMGGLEIIKESGSRQSNGLRLRSKTGKQYVLRSVDKDFGNGLPEIYHGTFISNIAKDQASIGYPLAALTITPMIAVTGIYHTNPIVVFVPKQKALNEYNDKYGDQLYIFEERPDDDQQDASWFGNSKNVISTEKLFENLHSDNDRHVDQPAFVKARLFDMFVGDWGRHDDQWRWASFKEDKTTIYRPIPRDRDQAYTRFDGFFPFIATNIAGGTQLESFGNNIKSIRSFNKPGRSLDEHFTNELTKAQWISAATELQRSITDPVIDEGMQKLPSQLYAINGAKITARLRARRDHLQDFAVRYYNNLSKHISIYGSDDRELFEINRISRNETRISVYKIKKDGSTEKTPFYSRTIFDNETKEVRLYGFNGDDKYVLKGLAGADVKVRVMGFTAGDIVEKNTSGRDSKTKIYKGESWLYDTVFQKSFKVSPIVIVNPAAYRYFEKDVLSLFTKPGLHVGVNFIYRPKTWLKDEDEPTHNIAFNYGFLRKTMYVNYVGIFPHALGSWDLLLKGKYDFPAAENFHGVGNESKDSAGAAPTYYSVYSKRLYAGIGIQKKIADVHQFDVSVYYQEIKINRDDETYIQEKENTLPVFNNNRFAGIEAGYNYRDVNDEALPTKGINFFISAGYIAGINKPTNSFFKGMSNFSFYVPLGRLFSFASRVGGGTMVGNAPYYYLNTLGGNINLRGYTRERFYGKSSFYNNNEIRLITNTHNIVFNGKAGLFGFFDNGRVWQPAEKSTTWHYGYGAGILLSPFNKFVLMGSYGLSKEGSQILVKAEIFF